MLLKRLVVENFGPFHGLHTVDLLFEQPTENQPPVILFGGRNGSGKTSLLEAIRLCLHGRYALGNLRTVDYYDYLRHRIHQGSDGKRLLRSSVRLEIETVEVGQKHIYEITRSWRDATKVAEKLEISRNGEALKELYVDQYQAFLNELVPLGLAEFFFIDGERIQRLAEANGSDRVVADSVRSLLGLHLTSRLQADIAILMRSRDSSRPTEEAQAEIEAIRSRLKKVRDRIKELEAEHRVAEHRSSSLERAVELQEQKIASEGGDFARRREHLIKTQSTWEATLQSCETELRELANDLLPFSLVPELCEAVRQRVEEETEALREEFALSVLNTKQQELLKALNSSKFWEETFGDTLTKKDRKSVTKALQCLIKQIVPDVDHQDRPKVHDLSERDKQTLFATIGAVLTDIPRQAAQLIATAEEARQHLVRVEQDLQRVPKEEVLKPLVDELGRLQEKLSDARREQMNLEAELRRTNMEQEDIERSIKRTVERQRHLEQKTKAMALATKIRSALHSYEQELTIARISHLAECVTECYRQLAHKESLCSHVRFDPKTLAISLFDDQGHVVYRPLLSAGEKQILAIAILWGLGRASGRELPIVIDTPLARLDTEHRGRLLSRYFPHASHQVILLSTDSEITDKGLKALSPSIAKAFHLQFDPERGRTTIEEGYLPVQER